MQRPLEGLPDHAGIQRIHSRAAKRRDRIHPAVNSYAEGEMQNRDLAGFFVHPAFHSTVERALSFGKNRLNDCTDLHGP